MHQEIDADAGAPDSGAPFVESLLPAGEESGTAPEDRAFRPDVEGLRAVAILFVVMLHFGVPHLAGGIVGVDVFFVISGFVITGLLLREVESTSRISFLPFYARRARRLLPLALLVIVVSMIATAAIASRSVTVSVASDGRWSALFLANFHFASVFPNVLIKRESPISAYWSLAIEEQFYLLYPAFFLRRTPPDPGSLDDSHSTPNWPGRHRRDLTGRLHCRFAQRTTGALLRAFHPGVGVGRRRIGRRIHT